MNRRLFSALVILVMVFCGGVLYVLINAAAEPKNGEAWGADTAYIARGHLLEPYFREPFETSIMIYADLSYVTWTTHHDGAVFGTAEERVAYLKSIFRPIDGVTMMVHNHHLPGGFSFGDKKFYRDMHRLGFQGAYGIYQTFNRKDPLMWLPESLTKEK